MHKTTFTLCVFDQWVSVVSVCWDSTSFQLSEVLTQRSMILRGEEICSPLTWSSKEPGHPSFRFWFVCLSCSVVSCLAVPSVCPDTVSLHPQIYGQTVVKNTPIRLCRKTLCVTWYHFLFFCPLGFLLL